MRNLLTWGTLDYYISRLTSTENNPPLRIDICNQNLSDDDAIRLADALLHCSGGGSRRGSTLKMLRLRGNNITSTGFLAICEAIGGVTDSASALEELDMGYNRVVSNIDDFTFAMYLLFSGAPNLKHLDLTGNRIGFANDGGMNLVREILSLNEHCGGRLETLNLSHNFLCDRAAILLAETMMMSDFKTSLKRLDLSLNHIGVRGASALAEVVACNSPLEHLLLRYNSVGDSGAALFSSALKTNDTLLELNLGYNGITSVGMNALKMAVYDTSSLDSIAQSNHTVSIMFCGYCADYNDLRKGCTKEELLEMDQVLRINALPKHYPDLPPVPQLKMAFRLRQNFDIKYFHHIDRKHMPEVLRFVSAHVGADELFYLMKEVPLEVCAS